MADEDRSHSTPVPMEHPDEHDELDVREKLDHPASHDSTSTTRAEIAQSLQAEGDASTADEIASTSTDDVGEVPAGGEHTGRNGAPPDVEEPGVQVTTQDGSPSTTEHPSSAVSTPVPGTPATPSMRTTLNRTDSQSTTATTATRGTSHGTRSSMVFVISALEAISSSKDAKKRKPLAESAQRALSAIRNAAGDASQIDPETLFEPLNLATEAATVSVVTAALDCIGKLISYSYFSVPASVGRAEEEEEESPSKPPLIDRAIDTICDCFQGEATPAEIQMQIIKSLLAAILNDKIVVHGAGLLKSVRQTYNIFLLSKSSANQQIAQGTLTQMINTVFERVKVRLSAKAARTSGSSPSLPGETFESTADDADAAAAGEDEDASVHADAEPPSDKDAPPMTLQTFETRRSFDDARITDAAPTTVSRAQRKARDALATTSADIPSITVQGEGHEAFSEDEEEDEIYIRDAFLVFRAMCKLSTKALRVEEAQDVKSAGMRSKLLSLHIVHTVLFNHAVVFTAPHATIRSSTHGEPTGFTQAIKQYLCLSLSRNGASSVPRVFEVSAEIFLLMIQHLRTQLKRELEVFFKEIYLAVLDKRAAPGWQKSYIVQHVFTKIAADPKALVELYLNYDCDSLENIYQRIIEHVQRTASQPLQVTAQQQVAYADHVRATTAGAHDWRERGTLPPSLATVSMSATNEPEPGFPPEYALKIQSLRCLVETLRSMVQWGQQGVPGHAAGAGGSPEGGSRASIDDLHLRESMDHRGEAGPADGSSVDTPIADDDPEALERAKRRKTALNNAMRQFNYKPKRGLKTLLAEGFIPSADPHDVARFFLNNPLVNKKSLGEFLGEGDEENIKVMHAFVDLMDFSRTRFVDSLRRFLQSFRLPGEAQKIDRLMLKFAERYTHGNPSAFANADTAYVLAYSVILLNTDQHSGQVKKRMTPEDFIKNNRGINDNADLPDEYLLGIYEGILHDEIVLNDEREREANLGAAPPPAPGGIMGALTNAGRDLQREAYAQASDEMSNRTEQLFRSMLRAQRRGGGAGRHRFLAASSSKHVGPMFSLTWMSFLTALSGTAQETQNLDVVRLCMDGWRAAIRLACLFDLEDPRQAFVGSLSRSTNLYNLSEMKAKNIEALKALLEVAFAEGDWLKESWREVLTSISQLDRFQLISSGIEEGAVPDMLRTQGGPAAAVKRADSLPRRPSSRAPAGAPYQTDIAEESRSADMVRVVDRIFTGTANLSGDAIVHFVRALVQVSWQEIQSSGQSDTPRTYSLQKLVEISGYNMRRVRFEWTSIWQILGQHFIEVGCHHNTHVVFFALNSLRQLSMRFMEIEELPGFKFQKDFLKPFELILSNASQVAVKDMVLRCLIQMIQARGDMIRSGWRTMFGVFTVAAREPHEGIVNLAFDHVTQIYGRRFGVVVSQGAFADLVVCLTEFSKNQRFQKKSLQAIETLKSTVPKMLRTPECPLSQGAPGAKDAPQATGLAPPPSRQTQEEQYWFPVLFAFHDVLMTGEDLEVRSRALSYLFDTLTRYGGDFPRDFWDTLWRQLLYPIFMVLKDRKAVTQEAVNHEELSVWLSTTLIQALRNMISLFSHFFAALEYMLDRFLDLLALCICQENDTLARIGSNCLQQLILQNVTKFRPDHWEQIVGSFVDLFARTEASELFSASVAAAATATAEPPRPRGDDAPGANALGITNGTGPETPDRDDDDEMGGSLRLETSHHSTAALSVGDDPDRTAAAGLEDFGDGGTATLGGSGTVHGGHAATVVVTAARRRYFNQIITKCVLQLLMIETVSELFNNEAVYGSIPSHLLLQLMGLLKKSFHFAKRFNEDRGLRTRLFREGFMKQPPNLLKQESGSASVYVAILLRMHADTSPDRAASRAETEDALIPLCQDILASYIALDEETQQRNMATWRPVVVDVLEGYTSFGDADFDQHITTFAPLAVGLMNRDMGPELQRAVQALWQRVCEVRLGIAGLPDVPSPANASPRATVFGPRRGSRLGR